jgi:hypothetical protein
MNTPKEMRMFRTATAAKRVLSRRASLVESSEQLKIEAAILSELRKGLYSVNEAVLAKDESDRSAARFDATAAYENAKGLLNRSPFPINEPSIQEKLRLLESAIGSYVLFGQRS